jgi:hypothetical protein
VDVVFGTPAATPLAVWWEWPANVDFFEGLASFCRSILSD